MQHLWRRTCISRERFVAPTCTSLHILCEISLPINCILKIHWTLSLSCSHPCFSPLFSFFLPLCFPLFSCTLSAPHLSRSDGATQWCTALQKFTKSFIALTVNHLSYLCLCPIFLSKMFHFQHSAPSLSEMPRLPKRLVALKLSRQSREGNCIPVFYRGLMRFKKCELLILSGFILMLVLCAGWAPSVLHLCECVWAACVLLWDYVGCTWVMMEGSFVQMICLCGSGVLE